MSSSDRNWRILGETTPYFGVVSDARFAGPMTDDLRRQFFASGEEHVRELFEWISQHEFSFAPKTVLDFGCGVGRVLVPLAERCATRAVGVDVSSAMLEEARLNFERANLATRVDLLSGTDWARQAKELEPGGYDLVHSSIVLQHIRPAVGYGIISDLISLVSPTGIGALHITFGRHRVSWRQPLGLIRDRSGLVNSLANVATGKPWSQPRMEMNAYRLAPILSDLAQVGARRVSLEITKHGPHVGAMLLFRVGQNAS